MFDKNQFPKFTFGIGLSKLSNNSTKKLVKKLEKFGKLDYNENPVDVDIYFVHFGDGYDGSMRFLKHNYDQGIKIAKSLPNVQIIGFLPLKKRHTKVEHAEILQNYVKRFPDKAYSPMSVTKVGDSLPGDKFIYRPSIENQAGGKDIELTGDGVLRKPGVLLTFIHPPTLYTEIYKEKKVNGRIELRIFGLVKWKNLQIWISKNGIVRIGSPKYGNYCWPPKHKSQYILNDACCIPQGNKHFLPKANTGYMTAGTFDLLEKVCLQNNLNISDVWDSVDNAIYNYFSAYCELITMDKDVLDKWNNPFNADIGIDATGRAWIYEIHTAPNWKSIGHYKPEIDLAVEKAAYGSILLALMPDRCEELEFRKIIKDTK
jgi:hypothetical protein